MNITIVGAGNVGTQFAVHCAEKKHDVIMYGSRPECIKTQLSVVNETGSIIHQGNIIGATDNDREAFEKADLIFITMPSFLQEDLANKIYPYVTKGLKIAIIPGTGGGECAFRGCMDKGATIFGLQRVPSVARLVAYGEMVCATGYRDNLCVAALPKKNAKECADIITSIFDIPCTVFPNYLSLTLTPSNPILHTTRLRTMFKDYKEGITYDYVPLFYEEWTNDSSELLLKCDEEVQNICKALPMFDLQGVKSLKIHYESNTSSELTKKLTSIDSLKGLKTPTIKVNSRFIPDLNSRYFVNDFSYGLTILIQVAAMCGVKASNMEETLNWYEQIKISNIKDFDFKRYGIGNLSQLVQFYNA